MQALVSHFPCFFQNAKIHNQPLSEVQLRQYVRACRNGTQNPSASCSLSVGSLHEPDRWFRGGGRQKGINCEMKKKRKKREEFKRAREKREREMGWWERKKQHFDARSLHLKPRSPRGHQAKVAVVAAQGSILNPPPPLPPQSQTPPPHEISGLSVSIGMK